MDLSALQVRLYIAPLLSLTIFLSVLNGVMFNVAVPDIARDYQISPGLVSWVITAYIIIFAFGSVVYTRLGQRFHLRDLISIGLILFCAGGLLGFLSDSFPWLVASRMLQASGASGIPALSMMLATVYVPYHMRGHLLGVIASTVAFGLGIGPILGGLIAGYLHWNYLLLTPLVLLPVLFLLRRFLPRQNDLRPASLDWPGGLLLAGAVSALVIMVNMRLALLILPVILLATAFILRIRSTSEPFVYPDLFDNRSYPWGLLTALLVICTILATLFLMPMMFRNIHDMCTLFIGLHIFPGAMSAALAGQVAGRMVDRRGAAPVVRAGFLILLLGFGLLMITAGKSAWISAAAMIPANSGFTVIHSSLAGAVSSTLPQGRVGLGMGVFNLVFFVSGALGTAAAGMFLDILGPDQGKSYSLIFAGCIGLAATGLLLFTRNFKKVA